MLLGLGSNNSQFTFGGVAAECAGRFVADGYTGWWEVWIHFINWVTGAELNERACSDADFATAAQLDAARAETTAAVRQVLDVLDEIDADGDHRVVLQDYTNPLPQAYAEQYRTEDGRSDTRDKYRALVDERYAAGCPADIDIARARPTGSARTSAAWSRASRAPSRRSVPERGSPTSTSSAPSTAPGCARPPAARATRSPRRCA